MVLILILILVMMIREGVDKLVEAEEGYEESDGADLRILLMMMKFGWKSFVNDAEEEIGRCWRMRMRMRMRTRMGVCREVR